LRSTCNRCARLPNKWVTLLPGEYKVAVRSFAAGDPNAEGIVDRPPQSLIPTKYGDSKTSGLAVTAAEGMEPIKLELGP
jgi:hypothetical protein